MQLLNIPAERYPLYDRVLFILFVVAAPIGLGSVPFIFSDGDVSWHVATGQWILAQGIPSTDPFSHSMAGQPWVAHEWLPDVILGAAFNSGGYVGLSVAVIAALAALNASLFLFLRSKVGPIALFLALLGANTVLIPFTLARPHVLVWPLLAVWTVMLVHYRDAGRAPPLAWAGVMLVWTNMHGSFPLGLFIAACIALDALISGRWERKLLIGWATFGLASGIAALANANGMAGLLYPFATMSMDVLPTIQEWMPSSPQLTPLFYPALVAAVGIALFQGARLRVGEILLLMTLLFMAFSQVRHQSWLAIIAAIILPLRAAAPRSLTPQSLLPADWSAPARIAAVTVVAVSAFVLRLALPAGPVESRFNAPILLSTIPTNLREKPVFNEYSYGGPLILAGIKPFIDGRADMYGDKFIREYRAAVDGDWNAFEMIVRRYDVQWTILPEKSLLRQRLDREPAWTRVQSRDGIAIHSRTVGRGPN